MLQICLMLVNFCKHTDCRRAPTFGPRAVRLAVMMLSSQKERGLKFCYTGYTASGVPLSAPCCSKVDSSGTKVFNVGEAITDTPSTV